MIRSIEQWVADRDRIAERDAVVPPIKTDRVLSAMRAAYVEMGVDPVCIWVPSHTWLQHGVSASAPVLKLWGYPVKELPTTIHEVLALHTTYDRIWVELSNGSWFEVFVHDD